MGEGRDLPVRTMRTDPGRREGLSRRGASFGQFGALLAANIKLDLRASRFRGAQGKLPPLVWAVVTYLLMGILLSWSLVRLDDIFIYCLFTLSAAMFMTALTVVMEYVTAVVSPDDHDVLAHRPVSSRTYFWVKFANLLFYVSLTAVSLGAPAAAFGRLLPGASGHFAAVYIGVVLAACIATAAFIVLVYSLALRAFDYQRFTRAVSYIQVLATVVITLGYVFLPRLVASGAGHITVEKGWWLYLVPSGWFAAVVEISQTGGTAKETLLAALAGVATACLLITAFRNISLDYSQKISQLAAGAEERPASGGGRRLRELWRRAGLGLCSTDEERAGFELVGTYMKRNRRLRLLVYPAFGLPLAIYLYGVATRSFFDPFVHPSIETSFPVQEILGFYCILLTVFFSTALVQSDQWKASWIFYAAPLADRAGLIVGARKIVVWGYLVPFFALMLVLMSLVTPPLHAAAFLIPVFIIAMIAFSLLSFASPHMPLSQSMELSRQARRLVLIVLMTPALVAAIVMREVLRQFPLSVAPLIAVLAASAYLAERAVRARLERKLANAEFAG